jgi:16S rRNA (cytosine1402-N4)-methyltransferase
MRPEMDGPLDMRFDVTTGVPAWRWLETASRDEICSVLARYGDGQDAASAARVADAVVISRESSGGKVPRSTSEMAKLISHARCGGDYQPLHAAKLSFQALRMHLNDEREELRKGLKSALKLLKPGGRIAIIT